MLQQLCSLAAYTQISVFGIAFVCNVYPSDTKGGGGGGGRANSPKVFLHNF